MTCYDYFAKDAEYLGATLRFMRSLKIAAEISIDYNVGLYGLDEESEEYDKVSTTDDLGLELIRYFLF